MDSYLYLQFAGLFLSFCLKIAAGYLVCAALERLLHKPQHRFVLWLIFLVAAAGYWLKLSISAVLGVISPSRLATAFSVKPALAKHHFLLPATWASAVSMAVEIIGLLYLAGLLFLLCAAAWKHLRLRLMLRHAGQPSPELEQLFVRMRRDFGLRRGELLVLPGIGSPATAYSWSPRVLLPESCEDMGAAPQIADVLYHELVHIVRRDYFWAGVSDLACGILFFHPVARLARRRLRLQRELACDRAVVEARPEHRAEYADSLAHFVRLRMLEQSRSAGIDFAASASFLGTRIRSILAEPKKIPLWKKLSQASAAISLIAGFAVLCPAMSILLDYSSAAPIPQTSRTAQADAISPATPPARNRGRFARPNPAGMPDSLTSLRVHDAAPETQVFRLTNSPGVSAGSANQDLDKPSWRESSVGAPSIVKPSLQSIVLSTIGGIAGAGRGERRGHDHDDHWTGPNSSQ